MQQLGMFTSALVAVEAVAPEPASHDVKLVARFRAWADKLEAQIEHKGRPMTQNPTPRRMKQYQGRLHDAANLERGRKALLALADAHENGVVSSLLIGLRKKGDILLLVCTRGRSDSYYRYGDSGEYAYMSPDARKLQALIADSPEREAERAKQSEIGLLEAKVRMMVGQIPGFFPTPLHVVEDMLDYSGIQPGDEVLEPSAGGGAIADVIRKRYPDARLSVIERHLTLQDLLRAKGHRLVGEDFLRWPLQMDQAMSVPARFDVIAMNPPFERYQDIDHVRHAYDCLAEGGRLVSIVSESPFFHSSKKAVRVPSMARCGGLL